MPSDVVKGSLGFASQLLLSSQIFFLFFLTFQGQNRLRTGMKPMDMLHKHPHMLSFVRESEIVKKNKFVFQHQNSAYLFLEIMFRKNFTHNCSCVVHGKLLPSAFEKEIWCVMMLDFFSFFSPKPKTCFQTSFGSERTLTPPQ